MPAPSGVRLRDSCQACAASKTKCSKDKPQCTRCSKRGTSCQYVTTKKTGRKMCSRRDSKDETSEPTLSRTSTPESPVILSSLETESRPELSRLNSRLDALEAAMLPSSTDDHFPMLLTGLDFSVPVQADDNAMDSSRVANEYHIGIPHDGPDEISHECFSSNMAAGGCALDHHNLLFPLGQSSLPSQDMGAHDGNHAIFATPNANFLADGQLPLGSNNSHISNSSQQHEGIKMSLQVIGYLCCLEDSSAYDNFSSSERENWINTLVGKCRKVTRTVSDLLQCHSSEDGYFLAVLCLVMSKVLDTYMNASRALGTRGSDGSGISHSSSSSTLSSLSSTVSQSSRSSVSPPAREGNAKAIQQLLDELYQVRAAMDFLGIKITHIPSKRDWIFGNDINPSYQNILAAASPFSAEILNQLYDEQRRRLKRLSLQLINDLKAFWVEEHSL